jgi:antitoxin MazE5
MPGSYPRGCLRCLPGERELARQARAQRWPLIERATRDLKPNASDRVAQSWHNSGMSRVRVSTTVDGDLLANARRLRAELADSALLDEALEALLAQHRSAEVDASYAAYDEHPLDEPDAWGDLASFREAAGAS